MTINQIQTLINNSTLTLDEVKENLQKSGFIETHYWSSGWRATSREYGYHSKCGSMFCLFEVNNHSVKTEVTLRHHGKVVAERIYK